MKPLSRRDRRALVLGLAVLGPPLLYLGAIRPYTNRLTEVREHLAADRDALARERALLTLTPRTTALRSALDSVVSVSRERLFGAPDDGIAAAELGTYLTRLARQNQVWLQAAEPRETGTSPNSVRMLPVDIQAESDFEGILAFLRAIEQGPKLLRVDQLSITAGTDTTVSKHVVEMRAMVTGYALGDPPAPVKTSSQSRP